MEKPERIFFYWRQLPPVVTANIEKGACSLNIRFHKDGRTVDRTVDMTLCRKVHNCRWAVTGKHLFDRNSVADIRLDEGVSRVFENPFKRRQIARVGELVECNDVFNSWVIKQLPDKAAANKACPAGDNNCFHFLLPFLPNQGKRSIAESKTP